MARHFTAMKPKPSIERTSADWPLRLPSREPRRLSTRAQAIGALALGALALGALAIGAVAIGRLAIGRARIRRLEIDELVVGTLRVTKVLQAPAKADLES